MKIVLFWERGLWLEFMPERTRVPEKVKRLRLNGFAVFATTPSVLWRDFDTTGALTFCTSRDRVIIISALQKKSNLFLTTSSKRNAAIILNRRNVPLPKTIIIFSQPYAPVIAPHTLRSFTFSRVRNNQLLTIRY